MRTERLSIAGWLVFCCQIALAPLCLAGSPARAANAPPQDAVLVIHDSSDQYGSRCYQQTLITLRYARIPYRSVNLSESLQLPPLHKFTSVLITTEMIWKLGPAACAELEEYVRGGGGLVVLFRGWNAHLGKVLGILNDRAPGVDTLKSRGLIFTREFFPGLKGLSINDQLLTDISSYGVKLDTAVTVFATTWVGNYPVAWLRTFGSGKVIFWNTSLLAEKIYRGFVIGSISCVQPWTAALILDLSTVCLDDFPLPSPNEKVEPIKTEFDETTSEFYALRWYPDMMKLSYTFGLKYTTGLIFNYAEMTEPPYSFSEWSRSKIVVAGKPINSSVWLARQVARENEMTLHGHNHQPLTLSRWGTEDNMVLALEAAKRRWEMDNLGKEPTSYIPPMNIVDSVGLRAVVKVFPGINVMASQYLGRFDLGQRREFGPDPWNNDIIAIPRATSGYVMDNFNRMMAISIIHSVGVWNHFVHPDDVIPTPGRYQENVREEDNLDAAGWYGKPKNDGLYYRFSAWLQFLREYYPWLRSCTLSEAKDIVAQFADCGSTAVSEGTHLHLKPTSTPAYYMVYFPAGNDIAAVEGGEIVHKESLEFSTYYVLQTKTADVDIRLNHAVNSASLEGLPQGNLYALDRISHNEVASARPAVENRVTVEPKTSMQQAEELIGAGKQLAAISVLERFLKENPDDIGAWKRLVQLYEWNNRPQEALKGYESIARLAPNDRAALNNLAQRYVWANRQREAIPLYEKILRMNPRDTLTMKTLAQNYVWANRQAKAIPLYEQLLKRTPGSVELHRTLADLYFGNSMNDAGVRQFEQILKLSPSDTALMARLADKYLEVNRQTDAIRIDEQLLAYRPGDADLRKRLAQLYLWNNAGTKAIAQYEAIVAARDNDLGARKTLARMYLETSDLDRAIPQYERICRDDPHDLSALKHLGELYVWKERQKDAIPVYRRIVEAEPDSIPSRLMLGRLCMWNGDPGAAKAEFAEVVHRVPANTDALVLLAGVEQSDGEWYAARSHFEQVLAQDPNNAEARAGIVMIRREHGLLLRSSYELTEDSNELVREQVPLAAGMVQGADWDLGVRALRQKVHDRRLSLTETGYGIGARGRTSLLRDLSLTGEVLATSYTSGWIPLSLSLQFDGALSSRINSSLKLQRFETTEGVQAIRKEISVRRIAGELFYQTTNRLSISGSAEQDMYSDNNNKTTLAGFCNYSLRLGAPVITLLANYAYQTSRVIYANSIPYWTPSRLSTRSLGVSAAQDFFEGVSLEGAYLYTLQASVFSSNVRGRLTVRPSAYSQILLEYEKLGSTIYSQNTFRLVVQYRY